MVSIVELTPSELTQSYIENSIARLSDAVQRHLDQVVRTRGYDSILSACTYANSANIPFQIEGQSCVEWRDAVWGLCYQIMAEVQAGTRPIPTEQELLDLLPVLDWQITRS